MLMACLALALATVGRGLGLTAPPVRVSELGARAAAAKEKPAMGYDPPFPTRHPLAVPPLTPDSALGDFLSCLRLGPGPLSQPDLSTLLFLTRGSGREEAGTAWGCRWALRGGAPPSRAPMASWERRQGVRHAPPSSAQSWLILRETPGVYLSFQQLSLPFGGRWHRGVGGVWRQKLVGKLLVKAAAARGHRSLSREKTRCSQAHSGINWQVELISTGHLSAHSQREIDGDRKSGTPRSRTCGDVRPQGHGTRRHSALCVLTGGTALWQEMCVRTRNLREKVSAQGWLVCSGCVIALAFLSK